MLLCRPTSRGRKISLDGFWCPTGFGGGGGTARIGEADLERLKAQVAVADLVAASGAVLARQGADLAGLCPFHL
jgi:hypothetical protein